MLLVARITWLFYIAKHTVSDNRREFTLCFLWSRLHPKLEGAFGVFTFRDFFPMLDLIFSRQSNGLPGAQQKMLLSLYPKLKASPDLR